MERVIWKSSSILEYKLAKSIADELLKKELLLEEYSNIILNIEQYTLDYKIDFSKSFPDSDTCITNNIISQISYILSEQLFLNGGKGVVLTPNVLAEDMVKMSIIEWVHFNLNINRITVTDYLYKKNKIDFDDE